jgi:hypothetical protein
MCKTLRGWGAWRGTLPSPLVSKMVKARVRSTLCSVKSARSSAVASSAAFSASSASLRRSLSSASWRAKAGAYATRDPPGARRGRVPPRRHRALARDRGGNLPLHGIRGGCLGVGRRHGGQRLGVVREGLGDVACQHQDRPNCTEHQRVVSCSGLSRWGTWRTRALAVARAEDAKAWPATRAKMSRVLVQAYSCVMC